MSDDSSPIGKEPCPKCGSSNNLVRYDDGHAYCFTPGCSHRERATGETISKPRTRMSSSLIQGGTPMAIPTRKLTEETCRKFNYLITTLSDGRGVHVAPYYDADRQIVAQKIRPKDKDKMFLTGSLDDAMLFGQQLWGQGGKRVVICEGEIDCLSVSQMQGHKWPVVSIPNGAGGAAKAIKKQLKWLETYEEVVLMFDMDDAGKAGIAECVSLFSPGKVKIASLPHKDPNECLQKGEGQAIVTAIWEAKPWRPESIISVADVFEKALKPPEFGKPWCLDTMTEWTYGRRPGELYGFGAGTGIGKTDLFTQQIAYDVEVLGEKVAIFFLEQNAVETVQRLAGKIAGKAFHVPASEAGWTQDELVAAVTKLRDDDRIRMFDHFGSTDWDLLKVNIRYLAINEGITHFYIDHLTALADPSNEKESLEILMRECAGLAKELGIYVHYISHLSTPQSGSHEEGQRPQLREFKGSRAIGFWTHFAFGLSRNKVAEDPEERKVLYVQVLKDRHTGRSDGKIMPLRYDHNTTRLTETEAPPSRATGAAAYGFNDETVTGDVL